MCGVRVCAHVHAHAQLWLEVLDIMKTKLLL